MEEKVLEIVRVYNEDANLGTKISALGLDSLDWLEVIFEIEDVIENETGMAVTIADDKVQRVSTGTIGDLVKLAGEVKIQKLLKV
jgi:acyl carrier protein